ncbi:ABC transporter ATP-binding protein [Nordella sp. HKS 07]|uniref:ABC transporter ATP-binding protein n=1 Tax=Nordella sp. HKS 07 TaxID=2712222 RepID=UPI0019CFEE02|nr:ABC transporter ATP-binding protein [Nordella sp. HKS 07]
MAGSIGEVIEIRDVAKYFGPVAAVDGVSFGIERGEFFSLLGPSGCGKTTLLRMLAGFEHPTQGDILIDGQPMVNVPANKRPTNMVFQSYAIFPHLNVEENVGYGLRNRKLAKEEARSRVAAALDLVKLAGYGKRAAHQLSGGQRQRVALARALVCRPKVLLLDEPLGALDKKLREEMQLEVRQLQRNVGITFVFVTHDQEEALTLSDRIAVMSSGKVLQIARADDLYENPNCREVAEFIGNMNLFEGKVAAAAEGIVAVDTATGRLRVPYASPLDAGATVHLAVRPEKLALLASPADGVNAVKGRIIAQTYLGDRRQYLVRIEGLTKPIAVSRQISGTEPSLPSDGDVWLTWPPQLGRLLTS